MDVDNGDGNTLKNLPCVMRYNQLYCTEAGNVYPTSAISTFADDNKEVIIYDNVWIDTKLIVALNAI